MNIGKIIPIEKLGFDSPDEYKKAISEMAEFNRHINEIFEFQMAQANQRALEQLNNQTQHTFPQLVGLMRYKAENIKARISPHIFVEVADMLENLQKELDAYRNNEIYTEDKIYTEDDLK